MHLDGLEEDGLPPPEPTARAVVVELRGSGAIGKHPGCPG